MDSDPPSRSELALEEYLPIPGWLRTAGSPLRFQETREGRGALAGPQYRVTCEQHPGFSTLGSRTWVLRYAEGHALEHGVRPPRAGEDFVEILERGLPTSS